MSDSNRITGITSQEKINAVVEKVKSQMEEAVGKLPPALVHILLFGKPDKKSNASGRKVDLITRPFILTQRMRENLRRHDREDSAWY